MNLEESPASNQDCLTDLFRALFNITGVKVSAETQTGLVQIVQSILKHSEQLQERPALVAGAYILLMNVEDLSNPGIDADQIVAVLDRLTSVEDAVRAKIHMDAILLATAKLIMSDPTLLRQLRHAILPAKWDRTVKPEEGSSLKARLIQLLRSTAQHISQAAGKLLFTLCRDRVVFLVYHIGFGNAAGFLYNNGMLGQHQVEIEEMKTKGKPEGDLQSDEEEIWSHGFDDVNPVTGQYISMDAAGEDMTPEEKEAENARLMELFEKLEKTGVMKVIPKP